ncbi:acyl-CoA N-acyltransferase, partial [Fistulina hepatica ATCC 64428]
RLQYTVALSSELDKSTRRVIWDLTEKNMRTLYVESSWGWKPASKRRELFHKEARFILVRDLEAEDDSSEIIGFLNFRFEMEENRSGLYIYDLQIEKSHQRRGIGAQLITHLLSIGKSWHMEVLMLTVFLRNEEARGFYRACGFEVDESSPNYSGQDDESDWEILSMPCAGSG